MKHTPPRIATDPTQRASNARLVVAALSVATLTLRALLPAIAQPHGPQDPQGGSGPRHGEGRGGEGRGWEGGRGGPMMPDWDRPQPRGGADAGTTTRDPLVALVLHHQQGIALANLATTKSTHSDLKKFAQRLIVAQTNQLAQLKMLQGTTGTSPNGMSRPGSPMMRGNSFGGRGGPDWGRGRNDRGDNAWGEGAFDRRAPRGVEFTSQGVDRVAQVSSATDFDRSFVQAMIGYQAESILAAQAALHDNATPQITALANQIVSQSAANLAQLSEWNRRWFKDR